MDNVICRQEAEIELTDVSQADLIPGTSVEDIGFSTGGGFLQRRRELPEKAPSPLVEAPPLSCDACSWFSPFLLSHIQGR